MQIVTNFVPPKTGEDWLPDGGCGPSTSISPTHDGIPEVELLPKNVKFKAISIEEKKIAIVKQDWKEHQLKCG
jgi:hypothetical protein